MAENKYYGMYQGIVTNIQDPEKRGRIKVRCPEVLGSQTESAWCDPCVPIAYDNGGDFCIPAKDEAVWLLFIAGNSNKPVWLGGWWQKNMSPLGNSYSNLDKIRIISYADCTILMQNGKININVGAGDYDLLIEDGKVTVKGDLKVEGAITSNSITVDEVKTKTLNTESVEATTGNITNIKSSMVEATTVNSTTVGATTSVTANGISLTEHTHSVSTDDEQTGKPE